MLTAEQRYWQARAKQRIAIARQVRDFVAGRLRIVAGFDDRTIMIDALARAYAAGLRDGRADKTEDERG